MHIMQVYCNKKSIKYLHGSKANVLSFASHLERLDVVLGGDVVHGLDLFLVVVNHGDGVAGLAVGLGDRVPLQITGNLRIKIQGDSSED